MRLRDMSDNPKRRFWQIHLSTAVVLMFVTGSILCLNVCCRRHLGWQYHEKAFLGANVTGVQEDYLKDPFEIGWPLYSIRNFVEVSPMMVKSSPVYLVSWSAIMTNLIVGLFCIFMATLTCEFLIRRREGRKPPAPP